MGGFVTCTGSHKDGILDTRQEPTTPQVPVAQCSTNMSRFAELPGFERELSSSSSSFQAGKTVLITGTFIRTSRKRRCHR